METAVKRLYEGMFLVDSGEAAADWEGTLAMIENILKRADAEVVTMRKWGERRLAYEIDHKARGTYILCYFKAEARRIAGIEKDVQLSEKIMRVLLLGTEKRPPLVIEEALAGALKEEGAPKTEEASPEGQAPETEASVEARGETDAETTEGKDAAEASAQENETESPDEESRTDAASDAGSEEPEKAVD